MAKVGILSARYPLSRLYPTLLPHLQESLNRRSSGRQIGIMREDSADVSSGKETHSNEPCFSPLFEVVWEWLLRTSSRLEEGGALLFLWNSALPTKGSKVEKRYSGKTHAFSPRICCDVALGSLNAGALSHMDLSQVWGWSERGEVSSAAWDPVLEHSLWKLPAGSSNPILLSEQTEVLGNFFFPFISIIAIEGFGCCREEVNMKLGGMA